MSKDINKKTRSTKKYRLTSKEVADIVGCSTSYVKQLRTGAVDNKSALARRVQAVDIYANEGGSMLVKEIERIVKL